MEPADVLKHSTEDAPRCQADEDALMISEAVLRELSTYNITGLKLMALQRDTEGMAELVLNLAACFEERLFTASVSKPGLTLTLIQIVRVEPRVRSSKDQRVWVKRATGEYRGSDGDIYRKWFEQRGGDPVVPESGTHASLAGVQYQW